MVFSSLLFLCLFLPSVLILYNIFPGVKYKNFILVAVSLVFYAWGEPRYVFLLLILAVIGYILSRLIDISVRKEAKRFFLSADIFINIGTLIFFKFADTAINNINTITGAGIGAIGLPLGLSFYIFQSVSYAADVYSGKVRAQKSIMNYLMYITMFPQLVAGPIVRYSDIEEQITRRKTTFESFSNGALTFVCGLVKKTILANSLGTAVSVLLDVDSRMFSTASAWLGIFMYTFQIYFDFSGYSDMATGLGKMLGFKFPQNFNYPYFSTSITDFWRRWHMTLGRFFRDYVYIPLGGNRYHHLRNIMIVWILTGIWHGAGLNFLMWGVYYGILLIAEKKLLAGIINKTPYIFRMIFTFAAVVFGWSIFYFNDIEQLKEFILYAFGFKGNLYNLTTVTTLMNNIWLIIACIIASNPFPNMIYSYLCKRNQKFEAVSGGIFTAVGLAAAFIMLVGQTYNPFLYFRF